MRVLTCLGARNVLTNCFTSRGQLGQQFSEMAFNLGRCPSSFMHCATTRQLPIWHRQRNMCAVHVWNNEWEKMAPLLGLWGKQISSFHAFYWEEGRAPSPNAHNNVTYTKPNCFVRFDRAHISFSVLFTWYFCPKRYTNYSLEPKNETNIVESYVSTQVWATLILFSSSSHMNNLTTMWKYQ